MNGCIEQRGTGVASCSAPATVLFPCRLARKLLNRRVTRKQAAAVAQLGQVQTDVLTSTRQGPGTSQAGRNQRASSFQRSLDEEPALPLYTCLDGDILTPANKFAYYEALRSGLKALQALGINGISVDVYWGIVEGVRPGEFDWSSYRQLFTLIQEEGFVAQVCLCFHGTPAVPLPSWVMEAGRANPDIYFTDRAGVRCTDYVSLGADEVPVLANRSPLQCYRDLMMSFRRDLGSLLGNTILDVLVGLGPDGDLKYPAHPRDSRWTFPGVGEFQCYDKYMLAGLRACAQQVSEPSWGLRGPHDAGSYCVWPHQTGFFHDRGNWNSPYGKFFLQWYGDMLLQHADAVLGIAREVLLGPEVTYFGYGINFGCPVGFGRGGVGRHSGEEGLDLNGCGGAPAVEAAAPVPPLHVMTAAAAMMSPPSIRLHAKLPSLYWWYGTLSHAPELTAGFYNTTTRDGYLPVMHVLSRHGVSVRLRGGELRRSEMHPKACCDPERQLAQQRTVAAALHVPVGLENLAERFDEAALSRLERALFDTSMHQGIEQQQVQSLVFNRMCDSMFEPGNWTRFKDFVHRVRNRADTLVVPWHDNAGAVSARVGGGVPSGNGCQAGVSGVNLPGLVPSGQWAVSEASGDSGSGSGSGGGLQYTSTAWK